MPEGLKGAVCKTACESTRRFESDSRFKNKNMLEKNTNLDYLRRIRQETQDKWEKLGFLDGLKGMIKPEIAELFECCKNTLTNEKKEVMNEIEVKKDLYKSKAMAKFSH